MNQFKQTNGGGDQAAYAVALPAVLPLPAVLRGTAEVEVYLRLPGEFILTWVDAEGGGVPAMPHFLAGGTKVFYTAQVLDWLRRYHGFGGEMKSVGSRPAMVRKRRGNVFRKGKAGDVVTGAAVG